MIARLVAAVAVLPQLLLASIHLRQKVTTIRHAHRHHSHHEAFVQQSGAHAAAHATSHAGVFEQTADLPPVNVPGVQSTGIVENTGDYKDEVSGGNDAAPANPPPAALVASKAASTRQQAPASDSDDSDGGDASQFIDGPNAPDQQETITREDMLESQGVNTPSNSLSAPLPNQQTAMIQQKQPRHASTAAMMQTQSAVVQPTGVTRPKGWDQCLKFARYIKSQDVTGVELVRVWKSTCEPAVQAGSATERYRLMCNSLGGAVEPYAAQLDYNVENLCDSVLAVFHDVTAVDSKAR